MSKMAKSMDFVFSPARATIWSMSNGSSLLAVLKVELLGDILRSQQAKKSSAYTALMMEITSKVLASFSGNRILTPSRRAKNEFKTKEKD